MFTVKKMTFDVTEDVDDAQNTACLLSLADIKAADLLHVEWSNATYKPSFFVCLDHEREWVVLSIRGTLAMRDVLTDVTASQVAFCGGHAHLGFCKCAAFVEDGARDALRRAFRAAPAYRLVLCGHSMAGSIATILAAASRHGTSPWPKFNGLHPRVLHMGGAGSLSRDLALESERYCLGAIHGKDPIGRLSIVSIEAFLDELVDNGLGRRLSTLVWGAMRGEDRDASAKLANARPGGANG